MKVKTCYIQGCLQSKFSLSDKHVFKLPKGSNAYWLKIAETPNRPLNVQYYCCEDHFDLENDIANYDRWKDGVDLEPYLKKFSFPHKNLYNTGESDTIQETIYDSSESEDFEFVCFRESSSERQRCPSEEESSSETEDSDQEQINRTKRKKTPITYTEFLSSSNESDSNQNVNVNKRKLRTRTKKSTGYNYDSDWADENDDIFNEGSEEADDKTNINIPTPTVTQPKKKRFQCRTCLMTYDNDIDLENHKRDKHNPDKKAESSESKEEKTTKVETTVTKADSTAKTTTTITATAAQEFNIDSTTAENTVTTTTETITIASGVEKCNVCGQKFDSKVELNTHISTSHTGEPLFSCNICKSKFYELSNLRKHVRTHVVTK